MNRTMELPGDDIWAKFGLNQARSRTKSRTYENFDLVPDLELDADLGDWSLESYLGLDEPIRHDCMWSGVCPSEEHSQAGYESGDSSQLAPGCQQPPADIFSENESSYTDDQDEEIDVVSEASWPAQLDRPAPQQQHSDHCYSQDMDQKNLGILTPAESSDDEWQGSKPALPVSFARSSFSKPVRCIRPQAAILPKSQTNTPASSTASPKEAKFRFHVKIKQTDKSRSVLRQQTRVVGSHNNKRKSAVKSMLSSHPAEPIQIEQTRVVCSSSRRRASRDTETHQQVRHLHNSMERQRRVHLKNAFDLLKETVPDLAKLERASKLTILKKAADYCRSLADREKRLAADKQMQNSRNAQLKKKLSVLQQLPKSGGSSSSSRHLYRHGRLF